MFLCMHGVPSTAIIVSNYVRYDAKTFLDYYNLELCFQNKSLLNNLNDRITFNQSKNHF